MKSFLVTVMFVLGLFASAAVAEGIRRVDMDPASVLAEIDNTPFGETLLSVIAVQLSTNGPLEEIIVLLNQIRATLRKDGQEDDQNNRTNQANCDSLINSYKHQIAAFTTQRNENIKIRDINQAALTITLKDLEETIRALNLNNQRLSSGQVERDEQHKEYANILAEHEQCVKALDGAIQLLQHLQSGTSFVQLKKRFEKVTAELVETSKSSSKGHLYEPLISALTELAAKASPEIISKILTLFNQLRSTFVADQQAATNIENKQMKAWISLKADLETERDQLQEKRSDLERQRDGYLAIIAEAKKNIKYLNAQLKSANANLARTTATCAAQSAGYLRRTTERKREDDVIRKVIGYFQKRAKGSVDFIKKRNKKFL
jgi:hypothetical protein